MPLFGFPNDMKVESVFESKRFLAHGAFLVGMIDKALNMLGENDEELEVLLTELGKKHVTYGVKAEYLPFMTEAIVAMLRETLTLKFTEADEDAWREVLSVLITDMSKAQRALMMKEAANAVKKVRRSSNKSSSSTKSSKSNKSTSSTKSGKSNSSNGSSK